MGSEVRFETWVGETNPVTLWAREIGTVQTYQLMTALGSFPNSSLER
jgi:hypothetical protein